MDKNYPVVETGKLAAVRGGAHIYSLIAEDDVPNGAVGYVGDLAEDVQGQETHEFGVFDSTTIGKKKVVLVANPEWSYEECYRDRQALNNYTNEAGKVFRAFDLTYNDEFKVSEPALDLGELDEVEVGMYVILEEEKVTLKVVEDDDESLATAPFIGIIEFIKEKGFGFLNKSDIPVGKKIKMYNVRVLKNEADM